MTSRFGVHITTRTLSLTLTVRPVPAHPHLFLDVGVSLQHKSGRQSILLGLQGHIDAEHNGAQLVPEVGLVLGRGQESGPLATVFPTTDQPRTHSARPVHQGWMNKLATQPCPSPARRTRRKAVVVLQMGLCLPPSSRCRVVPACCEFSRSTLRPWRGFCRSSCSSAFRPDGASREGQGLPGQPPGEPRPPPFCAHPATHPASEEHCVQWLLHTPGC